jgi:hypothetical protein
LLELAEIVHAKVKDGVVFLGSSAVVTILHEERIDLKIVTESAFDLEPGHALPFPSSLLGSRYVAIPMSDDCDQDVASLNLVLTCGQRRVWAGREVFHPHDLKMESFEGGGYRLAMADEVASRREEGP